MLQATAAGRIVCIDRESDNEWIKTSKWRNILLH